LNQGHSPLAEQPEHVKGNGGSWFTRENSPDNRGAQNNPLRNGQECGIKLGSACDEKYRLTQLRPENGTKQGGEWWHDPDSMTRRFSSRSNARKAASAQIAKIPYALAMHIARTFKP
jgi:hypothetical protein